MSLLSDHGIAAVRPRGRSAVTLVFKVQASLVLITLLQCVTRTVYGYVCTATGILRALSTQFLIDSIFGGQSNFNPGSFVAPSGFESIAK